MYHGSVPHQRSEDQGSASPETTPSKSASHKGEGKLVALLVAGCALQLVVLCRERVVILLEVRDLLLVLGLDVAG